MKNDKKTEVMLYIIAGVMFFVLAFISLFWEEKGMLVSNISLGVCFIALGVSHMNKKKNDE